VSGSGFSLTGLDKDNYNLTSVSNGTANITPKNLTIEGAAANNKTYDGTDAATVNFSGASLNGVLSGETVTINSSNYQAKFDNQNVGQNKPVTVSAVTLGGNDAGNYSVSQPSGLTANITKAELLVNADDKSRPYNTTNGSLTLTYTLTGFKGADTKTSAGITGDADCSIDPSAGPDVGEYPNAITCAPGSLDAQNYSFATGSRGKLTITRVNTTLTYTGDSGKQYSDVATLRAVLKDDQGNGVANKTVTFKVGAQQKDATTDTSGVAETTLQIDQAPGSPGVTANFTGTNNYAPSSDSKPFSVTQEDARANYTGDLFASTSSATSSSATVVLSTTVRDITAVSGDPAYDGSAGDVRNARVTFVDGSSGNPLSSGCSNLPVGLVNAGDLKTGTATCNWSANIGNADSQAFTIGIKVANYYTRYSSTDDTVVTVSKPLSSFITGGGYLVNQASAGQKAGGTGQKTNFGFNVKYNKSNTNLQGNINTIVRNGGRVYQIKGNSMSSLSVAGNTTAPNGTNPATATFNGKASIQDITNPTSPVSVDGNATLQVKMTDKGEPGSSDTIAITVWNKSGGLWFASNWDGTKTVEQLLDGGNLLVH
jgi:hypothetical protein